MAIANTLESNYWFGAQGNRLWVGQVEGDGAIDIAVSYTHLTLPTKA